MVLYKEIEHTADLAIEVNATKAENLLLNAVNAFNHYLGFDYDNTFSTHVNYNFLSQSTIVLPTKFEDESEVIIYLLGELLYHMQLNNKFFYPILGYKAANRTFYFGETEYVDPYVVEGSWYEIPKNFEFAHDIKAVTFHDAQIQELYGIYTIQIVFDV